MSRRQLSETRQSSVTSATAVTIQGDDPHDSVPSTGNLSVPISSSHAQQPPLSSLSQATGSSYYTTPSPPIHSSPPQKMDIYPHVQQTVDHSQVYSHVGAQKSVLSPGSFRHSTTRPENQTTVPWIDSTRENEVYARIDQLSRYLYYAIRAG